MPVVIVVAINDGMMMSPALVLPAASLSPITVVGISWIDVTLMIISIIMLADAV